MTSPDIKRNIKRNVTGAGAAMLAAGFLLATAETASASPLLNNADCLPSFYKPTGPEVRGGLRMAVERYYLQVDNDRRILGDITGKLPEISETFDEVDRDGNVISSMTGLESRFADYRAVGKNGQSGTFRARWAKNQTEVDAYVIEKQGSSWEKTGDTVIFSGQPDGLTDVKNLCGVFETRRYTLVQEYMLLKDEVLKKFEFGEQGWVKIIEDCITDDSVWREHRVRTRTTPYSPKIEEPKEEPQPKAPKQPTVIVPVQLPRAGDGSMSQQVLQTR